MAQKPPEPNEVPPTERELAPVVAQVPTVQVPTVQAPVYVAPPPPAPRQMQIERAGAQNVPFTRRFPQVRGGICEFCGVLDQNVPSQFQYKLCPHFRGMQLQCSYCPAEKNPDDIVYHESLNIASHPDNPNMLVVWCGSYECSRAHENRFKINR